ncbi:MAG: hypothetical protein AAFP81_11170 [Pseudomonadota bacterium]
MLHYFAPMLTMLLLIPSLLVVEAQDTKWNNPADKYADSYKALLDADCPIGADEIMHFVYFARDRHQIRNHAFLKNNRFEGAQIMYSWRQLEKSKGKYDFSKIRSDIEYLKQRNKRLFIQLQDVTFTAGNKPVPNYLLKPDYDGGVVPYRANGRTIGWITKRWNPEVQDRFNALLEALGAEFDGEIEGINLQETAIEVTDKLDATFSPEVYATSIQKNMRNLKAAFPTATTMQYANFMPGEWLPWEDHGYLRGIYETGNEIGVGLGAPDLLFQRRAQLNHPIALMHEGEFSVPLGIAIQDGNYVGSTGADAHFADRASAAPTTRSQVPLLHAFAKEFLRVNYMFWVDQDPYFETQVLTCFDD